MNIYIDFDGTLFDTDKYTKDFINVLGDYGINIDLFYKIKESIFNDNNLFNANIMVDYIVNEYNIDCDIKNMVNKLLDGSYVYSDVIECLNTLINNGFQLYLLTYGDTNFQNIKIKAANLSSFFNEIIITEKDKSKLNIEYSNSIFIDNNPMEIKKFCDVGAKKVIRIKRASDKYTEIECNNLNVDECTDFYQIVEILKGGFINE